MGEGTFWNLKETLKVSDFLLVLPILEDALCILIVT
jgi:hypothetical protein